MCGRAHRSRAQQRTSFLVRQSVLLHRPHQANRASSGLGRPWMSLMRTAHLTQPSDRKSSDACIFGRRPLPQGPSPQHSSAAIIAVQGLLLTSCREFRHTAHVHAASSSLDSSHNQTKPNRDTISGPAPGN